MNSLVCGKFMNILSNSVIGVCVGLVVALILTLILHFTCFREKNMAALYVAMFLVLSLCGGFVQYRFFKEKLTDQMPTPQEQTQTTIDTIKDKWQNTNGGFTFDQIKKTQEDDTAPTCDDKILQFECCDFGSYVVFGYKSGDVYQNALFYKSSNGLIVDGMIHMKAQIDHKWKFLAYWWYDIPTFRWIDFRDYNIDYFDSIFNVAKYISLSSQDASSFLHRYSFPNVHEWDKASAYAMKQAAVLTGNNITSYFVKFDDVELIGTANTGYAKINSFYNYLYQQIRGTQYNSTKLIDANSVLCVPIAESLQSKYPIPEGKKADYGDKEFYGVYKCNVAVELKYLKASSTITESDKNKEFFEDLNNDNRYKDKVKVEEVVSTNNYSKLNLSFKDTGNSDLTNLKLLESPVVIRFINTETNIIKNVIVDNINKLNNGVDVLLEKNTSIRYEIRSNGLVFDDYDGTFKLTDGANSLAFNYYYVDNFVIASVGLNPIGTIDMSKIDLSTNPVKIILKNSKHTYSFTFDDNSKLETKISQMVELGEYEYAILSNNLIFSNISGVLTITTINKDMLFNCVQSEEVVSSFNLRGNGVNYSPDGSKKRFLTFSIDKKLSALISEVYGATGYNIDFNFYDSNNKLRTLSMKGIDCSLPGYSKTYYESSYLGSNGIYKVQVKLYSDSSLSVYLSNFYEINVNLDWGYSSDDSVVGDYGLSFKLSL